MLWEVINQNTSVQIKKTHVCSLFINNHTGQYILRYKNICNKIKPLAYAIALNFNCMKHKKDNAYDKKVDISRAAQMLARSNLN